MPELPQLTSLHVSSARSISEGLIYNDLPTTMVYNQPITIHAQPKTDLWRKPPHTDADNAPTRLISTPIDINKFHSARVTVSANWNTLYDQGGLILFIPGEDTTTWMKTGIEFFQGKPFVGSVVTSQWSDWALMPLGKEKGGKVTIQVERQVKEGEKLDSLWVYVVDEETGRKKEVRQITSWFTRDIPVSKATPDDRCLLIGVYAARPTVPAGEGREHEELAVKLERFQIKLIIQFWRLDPFLSQYYPRTRSYALLSFHSGKQLFTTYNKTKRLNYYKFDTIEEASPRSRSC